jgi:hypothetical protein
MHGIVPSVDFGRLSARLDKTAVPFQLPLCSVLERARNAEH